MKRVNIIAWSNGFGLTRHINLLGDALRRGGFDVTVTAVQFGSKDRKHQERLYRKREFKRKLLRWLGRGDAAEFDANIMIEHVRPIFLSMARVNLFAPHPEWCLPIDAALLKFTDGTLCMTHHAEPIFAGLGCDTKYIGFTSEDRHDPAVPRERTFFHLAGGSINKGTDLLLEVWRRHPEWPMLRVLQSPKNAKEGPPAANIDHRIGYIDDAELRQMQNASRFHICSSETEGYGHYLVEAMGVGAVVLATDAPPMNEMITPDRGIRIDYERTGTQNLATTFYVSEQSIEAAVERALALGDADVAAMGAAARQWFVDNDQAFAGRVADGLARYL